MLVKLFPLDETGVGGMLASGAVRSWAGGRCAGDGSRRRLFLGRLCGGWCLLGGWVFRWRWGRRRFGCLPGRFFLGCCLAGGLLPRLFLSREAIHDQAGRSRIQSGATHESGALCPRPVRIPWRTADSPVSAKPPAQVR